MPLKYTELRPTPLQLKPEDDSRVSPDSLNFKDKFLLMIIQKRAKVNRKTIIAPKVIDKAKRDSCSQIIITMPKDLRSVTNGSALWQRYGYKTRLLNLKKLQPQLEIRH